MRPGDLARSVVPKFMLALAAQGAISTRLVVPGDDIGVSYGVGNDCNPFSSVSINLWASCRV